MSYLSIGERDQRLLTKLHASASDLSYARFWAEHLLAKKWFRMPWSRGKIYRHQSAYVTAIVVAYARVFAHGRGGHSFPQRLVKFDDRERQLHDRLLGMRHKIYAHSDLDKWSVKPWKQGEFATAVIYEPIHVIEADDLKLLVDMIDGLHETIRDRYRAVLAPYLDERAVDLSQQTTVDAITAAMEELEVGEMIAIRVVSDEDNGDHLSG